MKVCCWAPVRAFSSALAVVKIFLGHLGDAVPVKALDPAHSFAKRANVSVPLFRY
jgi:hypothetical protein